MNIFNILKESANKWGNEPAAIHHDKELTYSELLISSNQLKGFLERNNIGKGLAVAIIFPNSIDFIISLMGTVGCGALVMPIYDQQKDAEIKKSLLEGEIHYFLSESKDMLAFAELSDEITINNKTYYLYKTERACSKKTASFIDNPAFMRFTSGTTGKAKGVILSHQAVFDRVKAANRGLSLAENDTVLWVLPMAFHFVASLVLYLKYGATIVIHDSFIAKDIIDTIKKHKITFLYGSPLHIKLLASYNVEEQIDTLKTVVSTTTAIGNDVCNDFYAKYKIPVTQAYGIIEIGLPIINTGKPKENPDAVGYPLPDFEVAILDENFKQVEFGDNGLLGIKGVGIFDGYLSPPTKKEDVLNHSWFLTGDIATQNAEGLITIKGRKKNVINVSGNKVFPYEIEEVINKYAGILVCKAYSKKHMLLGEIVALDVVQTAESNLKVEEIIKFSRQYLSNFKVPQVVNFVDSIEMTNTGKIKR